MIVDPLQFWRDAACREAWLRLPKEMPLVWRALNESVRMGGLLHHTYALKLLELRSWLRTNSPRVVVELGSGLTTLVFGEYFRGECGDFALNCRFISVDENMEHIERVKRLGDVRGVEFVCIPRHVYRPDPPVRKYPVTMQATPSVGYCPDTLRRELPLVTDLLYVDGPNNQVDGSDAPCIDAIILCSEKSVENVLFDVRVSSVMCFSASHGSQYVRPEPYPAPAQYHEHSEPMHHSWFSKMLRI